MKMQGERLIRAAREDVWVALNDPEVLKQCIPGCEEIQKTTDTDFVARVKAKVGPVSLTMSGDVHLSDLEPPARYRISGQGKGGAAGFAKGGADIRLDEQDGGTLIAYDVDAQVGGKLAQIGNRLINSTARKMADDFFTRFVAIVESETAAPAEDPATALELQSTGAKRGAASKPARAATTARKVAASPTSRRGSKPAAGQTASGRALASRGATSDEPSMFPGASPEPLPTPLQPASSSASISAAAAQDAAIARQSAHTGEAVERESESGHYVLWLIVAAVGLAILYYLLFR